MKGIIIYGSPEGAITFCEFVNEASYELKNYYDSQEFASCLKGVASKVSKAKCSPEDTYDFETGALIALMKMCGFDKSYKAIDEAFSEDTFKTYATKYERELNTLKHEYDLCKNSENALKCSVAYLNKTIAKLNMAIDGYKNDLYKVSKRCIELEAKEDILNKQEKTINKREEEISVYFGGRGTGKQYKALVELFKKLDQKKVDTAYKEAYNTTLPVWQKEVIKQVYEIHEESTKEKTIKRNDQLDSFIEGSKYAIPYADKWIKPLTKREEMWEKIFALHKESDVIIKVKKEDVNAFLHEIENKIPEITWFSTVKIFETKYTIGDIYEELKTYNMIYFRLWKDNRLTYSSDPHVYPYRELKKIPYLPPMRWELFKKGRLAVKVTYNNYKEFYEACEKELGKKPSTYFSSDYTVSICKKDGCFEVFTVEHQKKTGRKIVDWEDVR